MNRLSSLLSILLLSSAVQADSLSVIQLEHRPAEEVIPVIAPMLGPDDAISGQGFQLFLQASPRTLARVRDMLEVVDVEAQVLQVSVFQGSERDIGELGIDARIRIEGDDASVEVGSGQQDDADADGRVSYSTSNGSASVNAFSTRQSLRQHPVHQVRVTEGTEAYIETGERIPYFYGAWRGRRGIGGSVEYEDAVTGFYVVPRIRGDNVILEINPYKSTRGNTDGDNRDTQSAGTTVTGQIGQWILVGGIVEQREQSQSTTGTTLSTAGGSNDGIWVRADLVQ